MKTAAAYIRVSTDDQIEYSPSSQLEKIQEYAKKNDYILPSEYIFIDEGISGRTAAKRPAFNKMIGIAKTKPKPFDAILLWKFSRFARNREDSIVYKSMLRKQCGIDVISISENIGDDKMSVIMEAMIEAMDEYYSINLGEEVRRGMNEKVQRGEPVTIPSFGYDIQNGQYIPNPETSPLVKKIFTDFLDGRGLVTIARELNENGYRTRRGNKFENRTVRYILKNPVYIGKIRWTPTGKANYRKNPNTLIINGTHEPIISKEIFDKVQEKLSKGSVKYMHEISAKEPFMLQGLVRCSACGATLCMSANHTSLQCYAYAHGKCNISHSISLKKINALVIETIDKCIEKSEFNLEFTSEKKPDENIPLLISKENKKLERIKDAYENGVYTLEEYKKSRDSVQSKITMLEEKLHAQQTTVIDRQALIQSFSKRTIELMSLIKSPAIPEETKNSVLKSFVRRIIFNREKCDVDIFFYT